jgi:hypothetical protein
LDEVAGRPGERQYPAAYPGRRYAHPIVKAVNFIGRDGGTHAVRMQPRVSQDLIRLRAVAAGHELAVRQRALELNFC